MKNSHKAESFIGIMVWIFILWIVILWIVNLLTFSQNNINEYNEANTISSLKHNAINIIKQLNTENLTENEIFYLYRNSTDPKKYEIYTGSTNEHYKYIDRLGNWVDNPETFSENVYSRVLWVVKTDSSFGKKHQIIKSSIKKLNKK